MFIKIGQTIIYNWLKAQNIVRHFSLVASPNEILNINLTNIVVISTLPNGPFIYT